MTEKSTLPKSSTPPVDSPPKPSKTVRFTYTEQKGWEASIKLAPGSYPFTERDWNMIERLLISRRAFMRREGALAYRKMMQENAKVTTDTNVKP